MEQEGIVKLLKESSIKNPENPSRKDLLKLLELEAQNKLDSAIVKEYFQFAANVIPQLLETLKSFAKEHVSKEYIESINKRIDVLNKEYENATTHEERDRNL